MRQKYSASARGTNVRRNRIARTDFGKLTFVSPSSICEQRKIAAILSSVDEAIEATQAVIDQLGVVKKAMMAELLTRGLPGRHANFKQTEIGEVPEEWTVGVVGDFLTLQRGFDITQKLAQPGIVPVVSSGGVSYFHSVPKCEGPGVVTGRKGQLGKVFYIEGGFWPHDTTLWVSDFKGNDARFVAWVLRRIELEKLDTASAVPTLNRNNVHPVPVAFPLREEQEQIADVLGCLSERLEAVEAEAVALRSLKSALMSVLLTGEVRVKPDEAAP